MSRANLKTGPRPRWHIYVPHTGLCSNLCWCNLDDPGARHAPGGYRWSTRRDPGVLP